MGLLLWLLRAAALNNNNLRLGGSRGRGGARLVSVGRPRPLRVDVGAAAVDQKCARCADEERVAEQALSRGEANLRKRINEGSDGEIAVNRVDVLEIEAEAREGIQELLRGHYAPKESGAEGGGGIRATRVPPRGRVAHNGNAASGGPQVGRGRRCDRHRLAGGASGALLRLNERRKPKNKCYR